MRGRKPYPSDEDHDSLADTKIHGIYNPASILPRQNDDIMVEYVERKTLSEVPFEVGLEKIVSRSIEIPSMIKLDTPQLWKLVRLFFRAENVVGGGCREDDSNANRASDELAILSGDEIQDGGVEGGHGAVRKERGKGIISRC